MTHGTKSGATWTKRRPLLVPCLAVGLLSGCAAAGETLAEPALTTVMLSRELPSQGRLGGVTAGPDGTVYISNFGASVWAVSPDGTVDRLPVGLQGSSGNHITADGELYQASFVDNRVWAIDPATGDSRDLELAGLDGPVGLTTDAEGRVFVANCRGNTVTASTPAGTTEVVATGPNLACPNGITWGPDGSLYVVNYSNAHVLRVSPGGGAPSILTTLPPAPDPPGQNAHVAFADGRLWVTRIQQGELWAVSLDGAAERVLGGQGQSLVDGPPLTAQLAHPNGLTASWDGRFLYLNDLEGLWRQEEPSSMVLRRFGPLS